MASRCTSIGLGIAVILLTITGSAFAENNCYCRTSTGRHVEVGNAACLKTNSGLQEARCDMVLNNTAWIFTGNPCPLAERRDNRYDLQSLAVTAQVSSESMDGR
jgi:hypothetical protein